MEQYRLIENPYRPGAGHNPPYLAGRVEEQEYFRRLLRQNYTTSNILITGLRGVGKTVLLEQMRRMAEREGWIWIGNDLSESSSLTEERLALRILTDVSEAIDRVCSAGGDRDSGADAGLSNPNGPYAFDALRAIYERAPGLPSDRLRATLVRLGALVNKARARGIVLAYDEVQCLSDHAERNEFPLSLLIETVASLQKREGVCQCMLVLAGLPQVFDALTDTRAYTERMFQVMTLERLSRQDSVRAIINPLSQLMPPLHASPELIDKVVDLTGGYPYLIQFFGKELVDHLLRNGGTLSPNEFPSPDVFDRLDAGLFAARWNRTTDKQRDVLKLIATRPLESPGDFPAGDIVELCSQDETLSNGQVSQILQALTERGMLYRTRHGRYSFTVPMSETMILRRLRSVEEVEESWEAEVIRASSTVVPASSAPPKKAQISPESKRSKLWHWH